ncbi:MAG: efflux RND transporter periplasmic adaptor subunit [Deltaproteobacteria bacterium]|nr:efflux RND transporter periplasmic adaptor subunit [Deltaproteobacteria bacterium]
MRQTVQNTIILASLVALLAFSLAGCGGTSSAAAPSGPSSPEVRYMPVSGKKITLTRELPGRVVPFRVSEVRPQVGGIIKERLFEEGSDVTAGQVLYRIDPALYEAAYNNARAELARTEANLASARLLAQRYAKIVKTNAISKQDYDDAVAAHNQAKATVEAARQALETAKINLGYTEVTASVGGRIGRSFVTPGALATQNQADPLATIQQLDTVYVDVTQSNAELLKLRRALAAGRLRSGGPDSAKVRLVLEDGSPYAENIAGMERGETPKWIEGTLLFSDVTIDQSTGAVTMRATFDNPHKILLPGMYVRAVLEEGVSENAVLVPQKSVMRDSRGDPYVYVLTKDKPQNAGDEAQDLNGGEYYVARRTISIDRDYQNNWLVTAGLAEGDLLLVDGQQKARPGAIVLGTRLENTSFAVNGNWDDAPSTSNTGDRG